MDPLVFMDYADDMNPLLMLVGVLIFFLPFMLQSQILADAVGFDISIWATLVYMTYGLFTFIGGFLQGEAEYLDYFVEISAGLGLLLFLLGFVKDFLPEGMWLKLSIVSLLFVSLPSTGMAWYTRESVYEDDNHDLEEPYDNDY